ncbi:MAG: hypothetical protein ACI9BW_002403 [Gammaproteobacteria bacterium]|jgi:hypothetical protein
MNWEAIGAVGETLGAAAVVISLVYVAVQIRQNTNETRTQRTQTLISANADVNFQMANNEGLAELFQAGVHDYQQLSGIEQMRFGALSFSAFNRYSFAYHQFLNDQLEELFWDAIERELLVLLNLPGAHAWWENDKSRFLPVFVAHMDALLEEADVAELELSFATPPRDGAGDSAHLERR